MPSSNSTSADCRCWVAREWQVGRHAPDVVPLGGHLSDGSATRNALPTPASQNAFALGGLITAVDAVRRGCYNVASAYLASHLSTSP